MQETVAFANWLRLVMTILLFIMSLSAAAVPAVVFGLRGKFVYAMLFAALSTTCFMATLLLSNIESFTPRFSTGQIGWYSAQTYIVLAVVIIQILFSIGIIITGLRR